MAIVERIVTETEGRDRSARATSNPARAVARGLVSLEGGAAPAAGGIAAIAFTPGAATAHLEAWSTLADRAVEPNPFFRPDFLLPYLDGVARGADVRIVAVRRCVDGALLALAPFARERVGLLVPAALGQAGAFGPLGTPLVAQAARGARGVAVLDLLLRAAAETCGTRLVALPFLRTDGPVAALLREVARLDGQAVAFTAPAVRAGHRGGREGEAQFAAVTAHRRKELRRLMRRLADHGAVTSARIGTAGLLPQAIEEFLALEASGWKGRAGTALVSEPHRAAFARSFLGSAAAAGRLVIDRIALGGKPVAMLVQIRDGERLFAWKIAHDESLEAYSPGAQVARLAMRATLDGERGTDEVGEADSLAVPGHAMIEPLWRGQIAYATGLFARAPGAELRLHAARADIGLETGARALARRLRDRIRGRRRGLPRASRAAAGG